MLYKLDIEKVYDHVSWEFVHYILGRLGFGSKWRNWVMSCISTASFAVMVTGGPSSFFKVSRGLRQDDPLSPFLFIIVIEVFSKLLDRAGDLNLFRDIYMAGGAEVTVSYLFFC